MNEDSKTTKSIAEYIGSSIADVIKDSGRAITLSAIFMIVYLAGWVANAVTDYKFDMTVLLNLYYVIIGKEVCTHGINSALNSQKGTMPDEKK